MAAILETENLGQVLSLTGTLLRFCPGCFVLFWWGFGGGGEGWWFGGLFCALLNHKTRDKHWAYALNYLKDSPPLTEKAQKM